MIANTASIHNTDSKTRTNITSILFLSPRWLHLHPIRAKGRREMRLNKLNLLKQIILDYNKSQPIIPRIYSTTEIVLIKLFTLNARRNRLINVNLGRKLMNKLFQILEEKESLLKKQMPTIQEKFKKIQLKKICLKLFLSRCMYLGYR